MRAGSLVLAVARDSPGGGATIRAKPHAKQVSLLWEAINTLVLVIVRLVN